MIRLYQWSIKGIEDGMYVADGYVSGHPEMNEGTHIHTSVLIEVAEDVQRHCLLLVTHSGNHYCLAGEDISTEQWERTEKNLNVLGVSSFGTYAVSEAVRKTEEMMRGLEKRLSENELFLTMLGERCIKAFFKVPGGMIHELDVLVHVGMFQDSILCTRAGVVDFRYFPHELGTHEVETYHVSSNIDKIHLYNMGTADLLFNKEILCGVQKIVTVKKEHFGGEGLFCPDVYDGKCLFSGGTEEE